MRDKILSILLVLLGLLAVHATAGDVTPWVNIYAHNLEGGGGISSLSDRNDATAGFITPDANDPSTWTSSGQAWANDWQGHDPLSGAANGKVGWVVFDFDKALILEEIFIWNVSEATAQGRRVLTYNIYYADSPDVAPVSGLTDGASMDYDFASGGWTQMGGIRSLLQWSDGTGADGAETLGVTAQYIGLEFITYGGDANRVGLNEVVFTVTPPPAGTLFTIR